MAQPISRQILTGVISLSVFLIMAMVTGGTALVYSQITENA